MSKSSVTTDAPLIEECRDHEWGRTLRGIEGEGLGEKQGILSFLFYTGKRHFVRFPLLSGDNDLS